MTSTNHHPTTTESYDPRELRLGVIAELFYIDVLGIALPKQLDLLDIFFPGMLISEVPSDGNTKIDADYSDKEERIKAVRYRGHFYMGKSRRVTQIVGRLIGTAKGSLEKERKTASLIQTRITDGLVNDPDQLAALRNCYGDWIVQLPDDALTRFLAVFSDYISDLILYRQDQAPEEKNAELFPIRDEVFFDLAQNIYTQWTSGDLNGIVNAFTWLVLGGMLRNETMRLIYVFNSSFDLWREPEYLPREDEEAGENGFSVDAEDYRIEESYYEGDDLDRRFPGIEWYCDRCGDRLDAQPGFDDHCRIWKCERCGYKNAIEIGQIYETDEDFQAGAPPVDPDDFFRALKERTDEVDRAADNEAGGAGSAVLNKASAGPAIPENAPAGSESGEKPEPSEKYTNNTE